MNLSVPFASSATKVSSPLQKYSNPSPSATMSPMSFGKSLLTFLHFQALIEENVVKVSLVSNYVCLIWCAVCSNGSSIVQDRRSKLSPFASIATVLVYIVLSLHRTSVLHRRGPCQELPRTPLSRSRELPWNAIVTNRSTVAPQNPRRHISSVLWLLVTEDRVWR